MISLHDITQFFSVVKSDGTADGATAILSVNLDIADGKIVSFLGPSGCGKSTLLEIIAGLQVPSEGFVKINGTNVREPFPADPLAQEAYRKKYRFRNPTSNHLFRNGQQHGVAMIFQDYAVFPWMTALDNVVFTLQMYGVETRHQIEIATQQLQLLGLGGSEHKYPSQLSGGMRQRLALARAFSIQPKILLMDEPFSALDPLTRENLQDDLLKLWEKNPITIVCVTHDLQEAVYLSDEIVILSPQPGTIRNHISVELDRPRSRLCPHFLQYLTRLEAIYHYDSTHESQYSI